MSFCSASGNSTTCHTFWNIRVSPEPRQFKIGDKVSFVTKNGRTITGEVQELADKEGYSSWVLPDSSAFIVHNPMTCGECAFCQTGGWCSLFQVHREGEWLCWSDADRRAKLKEQLER